jgi:hypothetical protein
VETIGNSRRNNQRHQGFIAAEAIQMASDVATLPPEIQISPART